MKSKLFSVGLGALLFYSAQVARAQEVAISDDARKHFNAGVAHLQDPDGARYEEAYREFQRAYALSPSWKILGNLGLTAMKLERDGEAIDALRTYLNEGGEAIELEERQQVLRDLSTLEASAVKLTLETVPAGATIIDERRPVTGTSVVNRYGPAETKVELRVRSGHHRIIARLEGHEDAVWEAEFAPSSSHTRKLELKPVGAEAPAAPSPPPPPPAESSRPVPTGVYVGLAATGAFAVGAGVVGVLALGKKSDYEDANDGGDPERARELRDSGQTLNLITDVCVGAALVSAGVTAVLYLSRPSSPSQEATTLRLAPGVSRHGGNVALTGSF